MSRTSKACLAVIAALTFVFPAQAVDLLPNLRDPYGDEAARSARPERQEPLPRQLQGAEVTEHLDARLPLDLTFHDEQGQPVKLGSYFNQGRPVLVNLVYYGCPMLCTLVTNGMTAAVKDMSFTPGKEFEIVTVSIDPSETPRLAREKKRAYITDLGKEEAARGWHFLTGDEASIQRLAETVGFGFRYDPQTKQFAHAAVLVVATPDGRVSRYLYGIKFPVTTMRLSLVEAAAGKFGSAFDTVLLTCFQYDPKAGSYVVAAMTLMRLAGAVTVLVLGAIIGGALWFEFRGRRLQNRVNVSAPRVLTEN